MILVALVVLAVLLGSLAEVMAPELLTLGGVLFLAMAGAIAPADAVAGFANEAVLTVAGLLVVVAALDRAGLVERLPLDLEAHARGSLRRAITALVVPVLLVSSVVANTPLVALLLPLFRELDERRPEDSPSLLPLLSYAAVMGGVLALPGTSTNVLASGLLVRAGHAPLGFFELTPPAAAAAGLGLLTLVLLGPRLLARPGTARRAADPAPAARYLFEVEVVPGGPIAGKTIDQSGLRHLEVGFLAHLRRRHRVVGPLAGGDLLEAGDVLVFAGPPDLHDRLARRTGLAPVAAPRAPHGPDLPLYEAVVAHHGALAGCSLQGAAFRERYQAVVLGISRQGEPLDGPLGRTPLAGGDLLLVEGPEGFARLARDSGDFYLVASRDARRPTAPRPLLPPLAVFVAMLALVLAGKLPFDLAALAAAVAVVALGALDPREARRAVDLPLLVMLAASIGLGRAIETSGLSQALSTTLVAPAAAFGPVATVAALYLATLVLTELASNASAVAIMFPVALAAAKLQALPERPLVLAVTLAASLAFANPFGYQTHLMVMAAGGLRARDLVPLGLVLDLACMVAVVAALAPALVAP